MKKTQFIIAAPTSNGGKTTLTLGLLKALKNRGVTVQPFKCGPDYIDPKFHQLACNKTGVNLDLFMMDNRHIKETYVKYAHAHEVTCTEGVMGLFDGAVKANGSTAELSKLLKIPVILVVNAQAVAYSVAPLLYGFKNFDPEVNIVGVIFNRVNTASHYRFLKDACQDVGVTPLGHLPFLSNCEIPSRHLGLSIANIEEYNEVIENLGKAVEQYIDVDRLLTLCHQEVIQVKEPSFSSKPEKITIAIARDEAFNFCYLQNIEALKQKGEVVFFSPLKDTVLPKADLVYLPGGYPECYLDALTNNISMRNSVQEYAAASGKIIAECGGMMYLGKAIIDKAGNSFQMANVFDFTTSMEQMKLKLGYRCADIAQTELKGHEFHYSTVMNDEGAVSIGNVKNARHKPVSTRIYQYKNVMASYMHLYFGTINQLNDVLQLVDNKTLVKP